MIRDQFLLDLSRELIIDNFAGGGGRQMKYHPHLSFPGYGWLEPFSDADMPLIEEEFARDIIAAFDAQNAQILILTDALRDVAQTLAWMQHGKCRGYSDGLLTTNEALQKARSALEISTSQEGESK